MKHAYLIIAHNNWWQLKQLIMLLDDEKHDIYVHIDSKSKDFCIRDFERITNKSKLYIYQEYKVYWGGYSQVQVELFLFEQAYQREYDYYHLLSGADLPLKSNKEIQLFFEKNKGKEFIYYDENRLQNNSEIKRRTRLYHFLQNYRRRYNAKWKNEIFTFCERILLALQIVFGVNRVKKLDWTIKYGSNWVSITHSLVGVLLQQQNKIKKVFSYTNCADELFIHTIAYNLGFEDSIYYDENLSTSSNMRFIDWERGKNGNPYTFRNEDLEVIMKSKAFFARKFSETVDRDIIINICSRINQK